MYIYIYRGSAAVTGWYICIGTQSLVDLARTRIAGRVLQGAYCPF